MRYATPWIASIGLLCLACGDDDGGGPPSQAITVVFGTVSAAGGGNLSGVSVTGGGASTSTDGNGKYQLEAASGSRVVLTFRMSGHLEARRTVEVLEEMPVALEVTLVPEVEPEPLDADQGGSVSSTRGAKMTAPPGAFVSPEGMSVGGMVEVSLTPLDPSDPEELSGVTGRFVGRMAGAETTLLESWGMLDVTVRQDGETLQVAPGQALEIEVPAPSGATDPPAMVALWSFDEAANEWVQEGTATYDAGSKTYKASISHMSPWNCDQPITATCITGLVKDGDGDALPGARIIANGIDYQGTTSATTLEDGRFYVAVRELSTIRVTAAHAEGGGQQREVMSGNQPTDIPPTPGDPRCLDVGEWTAERGIVRLVGGEVIECAGGNTNPFAGSCAGPMFELFRCFSPSGSCDITGDIYGGEGPFTIRWSNGANATVSIPRMDGQEGRATYRSAGGTVCATATFQENETVISLNGQSYTVVDDEDDTTVVIRCPNGDQVSFRDEEIDALSACGIGPQATNNMCTINGQAQGNPGGGPNGGPASGQLGSMCSAGGDCTGGLICCQIPQSMGIGICATQMICDEVLANQ